MPEATSAITAHERDRARSAARRRPAPRTRSSPAARARARAGRRGRRARASRPARWSQSSASDSPPGSSARRGRRGPGRASSAAPRPAARRQREQRRDRALLARSGRSSQIAIAPASASRASTISRSISARPKCESRTSGTTSPRSSDRALRELGGRQHDVDRRRDQRDAERDDERRSTTARSAGAGTRRGSGARDQRAEDEQADRDHERAGTSTQRATSRPGVAALSVSDGITNCGAGPGLGPDRERERAAHRVPVGRDHAPVDEVPALGQVGLSGMTSVSGSSASACGVPGRLLVRRARRSPRRSRSAARPPR